MAEPWQTNKRLAETNLYMLEHGILSDVVFLVGEDRYEVKANKYMLVSRSPVFYAMFCGAIAESRDKIGIPDMELEDFKHLLRFLYTEEGDVTANSVMSLLYAGKNDVGGLVEKCKKFLESQMSTDNVCVILQQAHMFDEHDLVQQCLSFVFKNGDQVLKATAFLSLTRDVLKLILESDLLQADEENVYTACVKWAEEDCSRNGKDVIDINARDALGADIIKHIRFPCMSSDIFSEKVAESGILSAEEKVSVFLQLTNKKEGRGSFFDNKARNRNEKGKVLFVGFRNIRKGKYASGKAEAIAFESSESVLLTGVSLFERFRTQNVCGKLQVIDNVNTCLFSMDIKLLNDSSKLVIDTLFDSPVSIRKDTRYTIILTLDGEIYYCVNGLDCVKEHGIEIRFFKIDNSYRTTVEHGQIHGLIFDI